jgi:hypothetical protein
MMSNTRAYWRCLHKLRRPSVNCGRFFELTLSKGRFSRAIGATAREIDVDSMWLRGITKSLNPEAHLPLCLDSQTAFFPCLRW